MNLNLIKMKKYLLYFVALMGLESCHQRLDYGVSWEPGAEEEQWTKDSLKIELEWMGDSAYMTATVSDKEGTLLANISRQKDEDFCTVIKYLRNDTGGVRGFLVYPDCYPMADRRDEAKRKEIQTDELERYKEMLWDEFYKNNHPCDIGLALAMDDREDRPYAARYYFKYDGELLTEVYDPISEQKIQAGTGSLEYEIHRQTMYLEGGTSIGDVQLVFTYISEYEPGCFTYKTYAGYRPLEEMEFMGYAMKKHTIFRSDRPEPFVTMTHEKTGTQQQYLLTSDYDDKTLASTYVDGVLQKVEKISQWGTVLQQDLYFESADKKAYICYLKDYNYQTKQLVKVGEERIPKPVFLMTHRERKEMQLDGYLHVMWGRFGIDSYMEAFRYCRSVEDDE
jgi:hypothetical protein